MAVKEQIITENCALYNGDCIEVMATMPDESIDLSVYSPPFATDRGGLYTYSSDERDLSNSRTYTQFLDHYAFVVSEIARLMKPGRVSAVHCMDIPRQGANIGGMIDFPGDIIRLHEKMGFEYWSRRNIWKEPLGVRNRTMSKGLAHQTLVNDSIQTSVAGADYLLQFVKKGENKIPVAHLRGLLSYAGSQQMPSDIIKYRGHEGKQTENRFSHWIWRQYASSDWNDVRIDRVLPYKESKDPDDERHVHPLQLDVIERAVILWSNKGEVVLDPFDGIGSTVYGAIINHRKGIGIELKSSYFHQSGKNTEAAMIEAARQEQLDILDYV